MEISEKHVNSHEITIFRAKSFLAKAQNADVSGYLATSKESVGSYFESQHSSRIGSGLTFDEEKLLMPNVIDVPSDDRDFRKKVSEFFQDISTNVPYEHGVTLEVGLLKDNSAPLSKDNMPIKIVDYIRWKHALKHPQVAASKDLADGNQMKKFYVFDKEAIQLRVTSSAKNRDAAMQIYLKLKDDENLVDTMLTVMGEDIREYIGQKESVELKKQKLRSFADGAKAKEFVDNYTKGEIEIRGTIQMMVNVKVLTQTGQKFIEPESREIIANSIDEMIMLFQDEDKTQLVTMLQARRQEAMAKPVKKIKRTTVAVKP